MGVREEAPRVVGAEFGEAVRAVGVQQRREHGPAYRALVLETQDRRVRRERRGIHHNTGQARHAHRILGLTSGM